MLKAVVVTEGDATANDLIGFVAGRVAACRKVRQVGSVNEISKSVSGNILRRLLEDVVLTAGGAEEFGRAFSAAVGAQGRQLVIADRGQAARSTVEAHRGSRGGIDVPGTAFATNAAIRTTTSERKIAAWAKSQRAQGRFTPVEQPVNLLVHMVNGDFDHRSGEPVNPTDGGGRTRPLAGGASPTAFRSGRNAASSGT